MSKPAGASARELAGEIDQVLLVDVREAHELEIARIPGAHHIPLGEFRDRLGEIDREADEAKRFLNTLKPPWTMGFYPQVEFLRLSLHKSLTSRAKERRGEQLKYWENNVNLAKERRKFLDEYKALIATRRRLQRV